MAENLRDLVVSLSLDGDNFSRNIKSINAQIREAESEFKAAGAGVSDFEGTLGGAQAKAQMLSQKLALQEKAVEQYARALDAAKAKLQDSYSQHEQLARALDDAKAKHQELAAAQGEDSAAAKAAADEVKKLEGQLRTNERQLQTNADAVTKATTGLNAAKGALSETQRALSDTEKELARQKSAWQQAADALSEFSEKATKGGEKLSALGKNLSIGVTAPITAIGAACYKAFGEVDDGLDTIITKTGASGKALGGLEKSYENVFGSMPVTAGDAATAIGEVNTRFGLLDKALEDTSARFIKFSKINGVDLTGSIDDVDAIMTKFGVDAGEVGDVLDYMTKVGQDTGISLSALMGSLKANGSSLKELGLDLGESITLLAQFESNGVDASAALAGMKKAVQEATADGKSADKALAETVAAIKNAKTETEALTIAAELFGSKGAAEMAGAIREGRVNIDQLSVSMSKYAGVVNETFEATLDLPDQATVAMNKLKIAGKELASSAMTALEPVVSTLIEKAQGLLEKFQAMDEGTKQRIAKIAAIVALVGPSIALIGKLTGTVGAVTGAISKFSGAVAAAGGGLKGLGTVLASSPALWLAAAAAVGYALYKLIDWISGAKAAREAMEALQNTAKSWKGAMADTFYSSSKGLEAYGISAERFVRRYSQAEGWLREVTEDWKDDLIESDETVEKYVSSFKAMTGATRDSLDEMRKTAQAAGYTEMETQLQADMAALDSVDSQIEALLKKRQETFLTEEDKQELQRLVKQHEEIEVKYKLVEADEGSGFDEIAKEVENARARASAAGKEVSAQVYEDAMVASAEGYAALNKSIDAEYDKRYELIKLMEDEGQKTKAQAELDAWYNGERLAAATEYAAALGMVADEEGKTLAATMLSRKSMTDTYRDLNDLRNLLADGDYGTDNINQINDVFSRMSEGELVELISLTEQINSLKDAGMHTDTIADMLGLDEGQIQMLEMVNSLLADVQKQLDIHDTTEALDPLREMFGGQLGEEVVKIATDLDLTGAKDRWAEFAEDPGAIVQTDAEVTSVTGRGKTFTVTNATINGTAALTGVTGDGKTFTVTNATVNADGTLTGVDGNGRTFTATNVTVNADGTLTGVTGDGKTFTVKNATVNAVGTLTGVTGDGKTFTVTNAIVNADGTLTGVDGNGRTFTATNVTVNADGTLTGVTGDGKTFIVKNATVQAAAALTVVTGDGKTFTVTNATINADGTLTGVDGEGKTFTATNVTVNANGTLSGVDGNGRTFTATNANATISATLTGVTGDGKTFTVTNATVNADGTLTGVDGEGKTFTATNVTVNADGTLTGVTGEGKTFAVKNATVQADGSLVSVSGGGKTFTVTNATVWTSSGVTLDDLTAAAIEDWQKRNASKVTLTSKVYAPVQATLGDDWQKDLGDLWNKGLLEVYGENGMPMRVTPELISTLSGQDLVLGTDSKGVYHIMVKPEWMNAEAQDVGNLVNEVRSATAAAKKYNDAYWEYYRSGPSADEANIFQKAGSFLEGWFVGFDEPRVKDRELEDIAAVLKKTAAAYESGVDLSGVEGLTEVLGEATKLMDSGYYEDWVNSLVTDLNAMGIDVRASTLADYYNRVNYKNADAARRKQLEEDVAAYKELREAQKAAEDEVRRQQHEEEYNPYYGFTDDERAQQAQKDLKDTLGVLEDFYQARLETEGDYWEAWERMGQKYGDDWEQQYMSYDKLQQMAEVYNQYKAALEEGIELSPEQVDFMRGLEVALQAMTGETGFNDIAEKIGYDVSAGIGVGELSYDWNPDAGAMAQSMLSAIQNATGSHSPATKFVPVGENIAQGVALGITNGTALVTAAITAMAQAAIAAAKEALGIHSPSKVFRDELGRMAMRGFGEGIKVGSLEQAEVVRNAAGYLTGEARLAVAGNTVNNYTSDAKIDFAGATFQVRDQQDIHALAGEIAALIKRQQAGRGAK